MKWSETAVIQLRRRAAAVALPAPAALRPISLPAVDADVPIPIPAHEIDFVGLLAEIGYRDGRGVPSERRITIRRAWCTAGDAILDCWCHERTGPRRLLASRIQHAVEPHSGTTVASVGDFLERYLFVSGRLAATAPLAQRLPLLRGWLYLLACLARPGDLADRQFIVARGSPLFADPAAAGPGLDGLVQHMSYDAELFERASRAVLDLDDPMASWLAETVTRLVGQARPEPAATAWLEAWTSATT